ncbi:MAG: amidohydrolase family protein [Syntrophales bacterium]|nr:amidohydrolase family protein [Syntrophales bacterium]
MIIDSHVHILEEGWRPEEFLQGVARIGADISGIDKDVIRNSIFVTFWDGEGKKRIAAMERDGIDICIIHPIDFGLADRCSEPVVPYQLQNETMWNIARKYEGRMYCSVSVDPRRKDAVALLERGVAGFGAVALKLHPGSGFYPNDRICYPLYEKAAELNVPVVLHTGPIATPLKSKFCLPMFVDELAADFPQTNFCMAHMGFRLWPEAIGIAEVNTNVFLDISGWQGESKHPRRFYGILRTVLDTISSEKVMWATDGPMYSQIVPDREFAQVIKDAGKNGAAFGYAFSEIEINNLLGGSAARFFNLKLTPSGTETAPGQTQDSRNPR